MQLGWVGEHKQWKPGIVADEKSDVRVVPMKDSNNEAASKPASAESVEGRRAAERNAEETPVPRTQRRSGTSMGLAGVGEAARAAKAAGDKEMKFTALMHHITPSLLLDSFMHLKKSAAPGVDGVTWKDYEQALSDRIGALWEAVQSGRYRALPSRRTYIPKPDGKQRPLGIAALEDKIVQHAVVRVLTPIYEEEFVGFSYGYRPNRTAHDALDALWMALMGRRVNWLLDADIAAFFDTVDHEWLMRFLAHRISDRRMLRLIRKWLTAGVVEDGHHSLARVGTPQGAVISPLLANIYLHYAYDLWVEQWRQRRAEGEVIVVRYADDTVVGFEHEQEATQFHAALRERLAEFGLALNETKTRIVEFGRTAASARAARGERRPATFDFLGFTHICARSRVRGRFTIRRLTVAKRLRATLQRLRDALLRRRHAPLIQTGRWLRRVLTGYFNYYAVPGNTKRLDGFRTQVVRTWLRVLRRRGQRRPIVWPRFQRWVGLFLPRARCVHPSPHERFAFFTRGRSRMR